MFLHGTTKPHGLSDVSRDVRIPPRLPGTPDASLHGALGAAALRRGHRTHAMSRTGPEGRCMGWGRNVLWCTDEGLLSSSIV